MISIYNFSEYRGFLRASFKESARGGFGQSLRLANHLKVHTTLVSQVLQGRKSFTLEQGALTAEYLELTTDESDYLLLLIQLDRAGNSALRKSLERQIAKHKKNAQELVNRLQSKAKLSEEQKAVFYSDWSYAAVRQATAIADFTTPEAISARLQLPRRRTKEILDFLISSGLIVQEQQKISIGPSSTHLESASPWVRVHHRNWRNKAMESFNHEGSEKLHYTAPLTMSKTDALQMRELIVKFLEATDRLIEPSPSEEVYCLNIDWFKV